EARDPAGCHRRPRRSGARPCHTRVSGSLARLVFPALRWRRQSFDHEQAKIDAGLAAGVGGFIIFGGTGATVSALTDELRRRAGRPLLIGADVERGVAQQVGGLTELPTPAALGYVDDLEATRTCGVITGFEARSVGINWAFAPVCDLDLEPKSPIVQTRSFGADPVRVGEQAAVWIRALQEHGVLGCAKHYPGHGRTTRDSHETLPRVSTSAAELQQVDVAPFEYAIRAGVASVMSAFVAFPGWDPSGRAEQGPPDLAGHGAFADGVADRAVHVLRGEATALGAPLAVSIVDDDVGGPYAVGPREVFIQTLRDAGVPVAQRATGNAQRIVLVYAEPRSWNGRADLGARTMSQLRRLAADARLVILFAHPRLARQIPGRAPVVGCWHGQPLMQRAAARWVLGRIR